MPSGVRRRRSSRNLREDASQAPARQDTPRPIDSSPLIATTPVARRREDPQSFGFPLTQSPTVFRDSSSPSPTFTRGDLAGRHTVVIPHNGQLPGSTICYVFAGPRSRQEVHSLFSHCSNDELELVALSEALLASPEDHSQAYPGLSNPSESFRACQRRANEIGRREGWSDGQEQNPQLLRFWKAVRSAHIALFSAFQELRDEVHNPVFYDLSPAQLDGHRSLVQIARNHLKAQHEAISDALPFIKIDFYRRLIRFFGFQAYPDL